MSRGRQKGPVHTSDAWLRRRSKSAGRSRKLVARPRFFETLEPRCVLAASVVINEFLALNTASIVDQDNDHSDWIELRNTSAAAVNLSGWYLTNDAANPTKWQFPSVSIAAGGYLVVFASGKDQHVAGQELHTNFTIDEHGGYLALEMPDQTVATAFSPYPAQLADVSYGSASSAITTDMLVDEEATVHVLVPTNNSVDATWRNVSFNDASWLSGTTGVGYESAPATNNDYRPYIDLDVGSSMNQTVNGTSGYVAYLRLPFQLADKDQLTSLTLRMRYDDGFVAYINGTEVKRVNAPSGTPAFTSAASASNSDANAQLFQDYDLTPLLSTLVNGNNVLAVAGLNRKTSSADVSDFLMYPVLEATRVAPPIVGYQATPTPGAANLVASLGFVADTKFSVDRGYYTSPFTVQITTDTLGAQIRYTLDGSAPTATAGSVYDPQNPILVNHTTILRAAAFKAGFTPSDVDAQTYIFSSDVIQQDGSNLPPYANWGHLGPDWAMDPNIVNASTSQVVAGLTSIPTMSLTLPWDTMFGTGGKGIYIAGGSIETPVSLEYFNDGNQQFQQNASVQIQGGSSDDRWKDDKLSMRVKFKAPYGPTKLDFPLFDNSTFDSGAAQSFDTLILDGVLNNSWLEPQAIQNQRAMYVQDQIVADLQNLAGGYGPHGTYVNLYIDGLYWGVYYVHERPDSTFASSYLGDDKDNYDVLKHTATTVVDGDTTAAGNYANMLNLVRQNMTVQANYQAVTNVLDVKNLADYMIINYYSGNTDWASSSAQHNWYASYDRVSGTGKWRFHSWDAEHSFESLNDNILTKTAETGGPMEIHQKLMANSEYKQLFIDEIERLMFNGGVLTAQSVYSLFAARLQQISQAMYAESARWGDNQINLSPFHRYTQSDWVNFNGNPTLPFGSPQQIAGSQLGSYFPQRTQVVINQFLAQGWFTSLAAATYSQFGGTVAPGTQITLSGPSGTTIYYTLDGSDPRVAVTAGISNTATAYSGPIGINAAEHLKARVRDGSGNWSPLTDAVFLLTTPNPVRIVEMNYHPAPRSGVADAEDMEFIELLNTGSQAVDLNGMQIDRGITYSFTSSLMLGPGQRIVIVRNRTIFQQIYGTGINLAPGNYTGKLDNAGEEVRLLGPLGLSEVLQDFTYGDANPWPGRADGKGSSLEIINPVGNASDFNNWRSSYEYGGTPGTAGIGPQNRVVVNEVLAHSTAPQSDAIELYNTTGGSIDISGWYLSDSSDNFKKFRIPNGTTIGPGQYLVFTEADFNAATPVGGNVSFALDSAGDDVWLLSADVAGGFKFFEDHVDFTATADGVSLGRWPNATGDLYPMKSLTLGATNSGPAIGPVAISEVMYNPPGGNQDLAYVEVTNLTNLPVPLSNTYAGVGTVGWQLSGMNFTFAAGTTIAPNSSLVVAHFDPTNAANAAKLSAFRTQYGINASVPLVGGWTGTLAPAGDTIQLLRPDAPTVDNPTVAPYVLVDEVAYQTTAPWPTAPNQQTGQSLTRWVAAVYGDEPTNWIGAPATPGTADLFAPAVTQVYVNGSNWSQAYRDYLQSLGLGSSQFGYAIPAGPNQASPLTWGNINQISIQFSESVTPHQADLSLSGVANGTQSTSGFSYNAATRTGTWTLSAPIPADQLQLHLTTGVVDSVSHPLDGEWTDNVSTGASGNGLPGGDFIFGFNVAASVPIVGKGDLNFDGTTNSNDVAGFLQALTDLPAFQASHGLTGFDATFVADINGDGAVNNRDIQSLLNLAANQGGGGSDSGEGSAAGETAVASISLSTITAANVPAQDTSASVILVPTSTSTSSLASRLMSRTVGGMPPFTVTSESKDNFDANAAQPRDSVFSEPQLPSRRNSAVDLAMSDWSMHRSRHLRWHGADSTVADQEEFFAAWK